jgi:hypothetical protein
MDLTLNLSNPVKRPLHNCRVGKAECNKYPGKPSYSELFMAAEPKYAVELLPSIGVLGLNVIRGDGPILRDQVGRGYWKASLYLAEGINPLYPGTGPSSLDLANEACSDPKYVKKMPGRVGFEARVSGNVLLKSF